MKRKTLAAAVLIGFAAVPILTACNSAAPKEGTVISKEFDKGNCGTAVKPMAHEVELAAAPVAVGGARGGGASAGGARGGSAGSRSSSGGARSAPAPRVAPAPIVVPPGKGSSPTTTTKPKCKKDEWELDLQTRDGKKVEVKVPKATYDRVRIGDYYKEGQR